MGELLIRMTINHILISNLPYFWCKWHHLVKSDEKSFFIMLKLYLIYCVHFCQFFYFCSLVWKYFKLICFIFSFKKYVLNVELFLLEWKRLQVCQLQSLHRWKQVQRQQRTHRQHRLRLCRRQWWAWWLKWCKTCPRLSGKSKMRKFHNLQGWEKSFSNDFLSFLW